MQKNIKKITLTALAVLLSIFSLNAQSPTTWQIDKAHSSVNFTIAHFFSSVTGRFTDFSGNIAFDPNNLAGSQAEFIISVKSINTDNQKRDQHLMSSDFFDADKFPKITFKSTRFEKKSDNNFVVYGNLTIKNITKKVALPFKVLGEMEHPMMKGTIVFGISLQTKIKRSDYGVGVGNWAATMVVGDDVDININLELNRMK